MKFLFNQDNVVRFSSSIRTAEPAASRALEQAWNKRRQELADWRPSGGWLIDHRTGRRTLNAAR